MEDWNSDLFFHVIQYLNVIDMAKFSRQSRRIYYLIHQYRLLRGPQLVSFASYYGTDPTGSNATCTDAAVTTGTDTDTGTSTGTGTGIRNNSTQPQEQQHSEVQYTDSEVYEKAIAKLQGPPNLTLSFTTTAAALAVEAIVKDNDGDHRSNRSTGKATRKSAFLHELVHQRKPNEGVVLGVVADTIQTTGIKDSTSDDGTATSGACECSSSNSLMMLAGLPTDTVVQPFMMLCDDTPNVLEAEDFATINFSHQSAWKMFVIYVVGNGIGIADALIRNIQTKFPDAAIVGAVCTAAYVSRPNDLIGFTVEHFVQIFTTKELMNIIAEFGVCITHNETLTDQEVAEHAYKLAQTKKYRLGMIGFLGNNESPDGICGVALAGDVPVRSVVSRGVESLSSKYSGGDGIPTPSTSLYVQDYELIGSSDEGDMVTEESAPPCHVIRTICDRSTGHIYTVQEAIRTFGHPDYIGLRFSNQDGFLLEAPHPISVQYNAFVMIASSSISEEKNLTGANVDFFQLSGKQCMKDMTQCMEKLKHQTNGEEILGAIMFSCNGRGPQAGLFISEQMSDAQRFANVFPDVPCAGFYACGEIGPLALAGRQSVFQQGNACVQAFTAVFALFIVPALNWEAFRRLDDSDACVAAFIHNRWQQQHLTT